MGRGVAQPAHPAGRTPSIRSNRAQVLGPHVRIDQPRRALAVKYLDQLLGREPRHVVARLHRRARRVWTDQHVVECHQLVVMRRRFVLPHIQPRAGNLLRRQRRGQRALVVDTAARRRDEVRMLLHQPEFARAHDVLRLARIGRVHRYVVGLAQHVVQLLDLLGPFRGDLRGRQIRVVRKHAHTEQALAQLRQPAADIADADDTDRLVQQFGADERIARNVGRATHATIHLDDPLRQCQQHRQRVLGHRLLVAARLVHHDDALPRARVDIDRVVARAVRRHRDQIGRLRQQRVGDL